MLDKKKCLRMILAGELTAFIVFWGAMTTVGTYRFHYEHFERKQAALFGQADTFWKQKLFKLCIETTQRVRPHSQFYRQAQQLKQDCQNAWGEALLKRAQELAGQGRFQSAIQTIHLIPRSHPQYNQAQEWILVWSARMLALAEEDYQKATVFPDRAIAIASAIPNFSPLYAEAQAQMKRWQQEWNRNAELDRETEALLEVERFAAARHKAEQIGTTHPYWQMQREKLLNAIAQQQAEQAQELQTFWRKIGLLLIGSGFFLGFALFVRRF